MGKIKYPHMSLEKALERCKLIFDADRVNIIDRESAANHLGYSSLSGASEGMLATLAHYGLLESAGKGQTKITQLGLDIYAPDSDTDRKRALYEAGTLPEVFVLINDKFETRPSEPSLRNWLVRENFVSRSILPIMKAYYQTMDFLEEQEAVESGGPSYDIHANIDSENETGDDIMNKSQSTPRVATPPQQTASIDFMQLTSEKKNDFTIVADGLVLQIQCKNVDADGVARLRQELEMYEGILKIRQQAYDYENDDWEDED